jgi:hypothetical protein
MDRNGPTMSESFGDVKYGRAGAVKRVIYNPDISEEGRKAGSGSLSFLISWFPQPPVIRRKQRQQR